jgi:hypothetical protein
MSGCCLERSLGVLKPGGILVSVVSPVPALTQNRLRIRAAYFHVDVTMARSKRIADVAEKELFEQNRGS